jgi:hypothetical protein
MENMRIVLEVKFYTIEYLFIYSFIVYYFFVGAAGYVDKQVLGISHLYPEPTCKEIYHTKIPYDPEGKNAFVSVVSTSIFFYFEVLSNFAKFR